MTNNDNLPNISESRPDEERANLLNLVAQDAAAILGVSLETNSPDEIVAAACALGVDDPLCE